MLVILDRDGVINFESVHYVKSPEEWIAIPGSLEAIARLNKAGHKVVIATNQAGIGRGIYDEVALAAIHKKLHHELAKYGGKIEKIYYCPHHPDDNCRCRKPEPLMLEQIRDDFQINLKDSVFIGDSLRDMQAAHAVSCPGILVLSGNGQAHRESGDITEDVAVFEDLSAVVDHLI